MTVSLDKHKQESELKRKLNERMRRLSRNLSTLKLEAIVTKRKDPLAFSDPLRPLAYLKMSVES